MSRYTKEYNNNFMYHPNFPLNKKPEEIKYRIEKIKYAYGNELYSYENGKFIKVR